MQFASPNSLLWLLLAVPIVTLYLLKVRWRRVPVSTVMFWSQIFEERKPRSVWQRLRHFLSLLFQLALLVLLALAVADPFLAGENRDGRRLVLVVDNSASMAAKTGARTRLDEAKQRGELLIRSLRMRDQLAIISAGTAARVEIGLSNHQRTLHQVLQAIPATDGPTQVIASVELARRLLDGMEHAEIVVLSDGCFEGAVGLAEDQTVQLDVIGKPMDNVAITQFQVRRSFIDVVGYQILVEVTNYSAETVRCRLEVTLGDDLVDVIPLALEPRQPYQQTLDHASAAGGHLVAKLDVRDSLLADNQAIAILPRRESQLVVLVTEGNLFLESALRAIPLLELRTVKKLPDTIASDAIVVFDGATPTEIPLGNVIVVQPNNSTQLWNLGEVIQDPIVVEQDKNSLLLTHVQLENVLLPDAHALEIIGDHQVLASSIGGEPLYASIDRSRGQTLVLTVDLKQGDLPLRTAFPIMITNAIQWFRGDRAELQQAVASGAIVECRLGSDTFGNDNDGRISAASIPSDRDGRRETSADAQAHGAPSSANSSLLILRSPDSEEERLPDGVARLTLGPLAHCGVWQVARREASKNASSVTLPAGETVLAEYACNLSNAEESNLQSAASLPASKTFYLGALGGRPIWFYLIAGGLLLTTMEWFLYQRRWIS